MLQPVGAKLNDQTGGSGTGVLTVPNLVSVIRLLMIPVFLWLLIGRDNPAAAGWLLLAIGGTDWVDGYLARRLNQISEIGKFLDPLADRLAVATAVIAGWATEVLNPWFAGAIIVREALVGAGALLLAARMNGKLEVRYLGKLATFLLYGAIPAFYVTAGDFLPGLFGPVAWITGITGLALYYLVGARYALDVKEALTQAEPG
ncbi:MAG TPA: CDP-alcohol phosphatidyltransferase family protein [Acidimicrobiia bacterium]|nr:CDP-alcohol phosphatidyltransferase family protein [Acidimicrobiia bacterium]